MLLSLNFNIKLTTKVEGFPIKIKKNIILMSTTMLLSPVLLSTNIVSASESEANSLAKDYVNNETSYDTLEDKYLEENNEENINNLNQIFLEAYNTSKDLHIEKSETDEEAYAVLLQNTEHVSLNSDGLLEVDYNSIPVFDSFSEDSKNGLIGFVERMNSLVVNQAISIDKNFIFTFVEDIETEVRISPFANIISIMTTTRNNAKTLKSVFNNAPFSTRHVTAGLYFAQRVRTGGAWDFKASLGTRTLYNVSDLGRSMTGEAIGNFHYGYVGRTVFSGATLKSAAGMYQVISGTSSVKYYASFFDDPRDQAQIQLGISQYDSEH